jgi:hypothetical protein
MNQGSQRPRLIAAALVAVAAMAAAAQPAAAADPIYAGQICSDKVYHDKSHVCGIATAEGYIWFTNVGVHKVAVFILPPDIDTGTWDGTIHGSRVQRGWLRGQNNILS